MRLLLLCLLNSGRAETDSANDGTCDKNGDCTRESVDVNQVLESASSSAKFVPFRYTSKNRYVDDWEKFITAYGKWQKAILENPNIKCSDYQAVVFKNTAGLGDSANALSAAFMYTINAGLMFFIDWKPWAWSDAFSGPGFPVDYQALLADNQICQGRNVIHLSGHITAKHRLAMIKRVNMEVNFLATRFFQHFFAPSEAVQSIVDSFSPQISEKTVALVIRTGWDDWQQFLLPEDPDKFPLCLKGWRDAGGLPSDINIFVTSDREDVKKATLKKLKEMNFNAFALKDSATHVQTPEGLEKVQKTIAEFHLLSKCGYGLLTSSSLFGKTAIGELGGKDTYSNQKFFFISAADCDRQHKGYYRCANPKYPPFCPTENDDYEW